MEGRAEAVTCAVMQAKENDVVLVAGKGHEDYQIVGFAQADPDIGLISDESPVGKALLGHRLGDTVEVEVPAGVISFEVLEIYPNDYKGRWS